MDISTETQTQREQGSVEPEAAPEPILWFDTLSREDVPLAGGKGANLGEMTRAGLPVPPGFVVRASSFREAMAPVRAAARAVAAHRPG
jgi:pyruvate,water dikinase